MLFALHVCRPAQASAHKTRGATWDKNRLDELYGAIFMLCFFCLFFYILKLVPRLFSCLGECCNAVVLGSWEILFVGRETYADLSLMTQIIHALR